MTERKALNIALEALNDMACWKEGREVDMGFDEPYAADTSRKAITAIKEALAQPKQKPVAWRYRMPVEDGHWVWNYATYIDDPKDQRCEPLYTTPPQRKPLTDEEIESLYESTESVNWGRSFARAIEAAHGIKGEA